MKDFLNNIVEYLKENLVKYLLMSVTAILFTGYLINTFLKHGVDAVVKQQYLSLLDPWILLDPSTYAYGLFASIALLLISSLYSTRGSKLAKNMMKKSGKAGVVSDLENSRFMTDKERDFNFQPYDFLALPSSKKDGVPVRAQLIGKKLSINLAGPMHGLIIGSTGSGKTTTFINPMIQILGKAGAGSSMICTDPKGELFQSHSKTLQEDGYNVMVLDLRDAYSSFRWNPLGVIYDMHREFIEAGNGIFKRRDKVEDAGLQMVEPAGNYGAIWFEYRGRAYGTRKVLINEIKLKKQKIYDELYEDLNDLVGVLCPVESKDDPVWEKGARSIILAVLLAMLEDSEDPELEMTKEKFNFFNLNKAISNSEKNFEELKKYFGGRSKLSRAVNLSRQVLSAAENTLASYMSIAFDKLSMFNDEGLCALTSDTDINPAVFCDEKTALFLKIPDEKDTRHGLASLFILSIYKALIKRASAREDLSLPRNVYFILDEFGNMPKIDKFDKMITVGRSRKIWFNMVVQSYAQLNNIYGDTIADIIKSNCGMKMFIGSNDIETCKEFSELCGNMTISTSSVSSQIGDKSGNVSISSQMQTRPLIYPSELQKLNNKTDTGNAIIVTFGNYPLKSKFTPSYQCPLYSFGVMEMNGAVGHAFFGDEIFYDLAARNAILVSRQQALQTQQAANSGGPTGIASPEGPVR